MLNDKLTFVGVIRGGGERFFSEVGWDVGCVVGDFQMSKQ
jgi:hypothetical protein